MNVAFENNAISERQKQAILLEIGGLTIKNSTTRNHRMMFREKFPLLDQESIEVCEVHDFIKSLGIECSVERDLIDPKGLIIR